MAIIMRATDNLNFKYMNELTISTLQFFASAIFVFHFVKPFHVNIIFFFIELRLHSLTIVHLNHNIRKA